MTLSDPTLLQRAAQVMPHRLTRLHHWPEEWWAVWLTDPHDPDGTGFLSLGSDARPNLTRLLEACWAECDARGWTWMIGVYAPGEYRGTVETPMGFWNENAPTPAEALLTALLSALEAQT